MKMRDMDDLNGLNLKDAFSLMPESCRAALMDAARSVKEEKEIKRASFRVVLIVASILVVTMVAALAATQLGLIDLFKNDYNITLPDSAKTMLSATEQKTYTVGPLGITLRETLADGRIAYVNTQAKPADGSMALIQQGNGDISEGIPDSEAARLKVPEGTSFTDAAKQANVPLYVVSSYFTIDEKITSNEKYAGGEEMQDILWAEDGSALLVDMLTTDSAFIPESLPGTLTLRVQEVGSAAGESDWKVEEEITIPVNGVTAEKTYAPEGEARFSGFTVQSMKAEQTCAGVYLSVTLTAKDGASQDDAWALGKFVEFRDAQGKAFPLGINLSDSLDDKDWPALVYKTMITADALPDTLQMADTRDGGSVTLK